jgi:hypothetical protein
LSDGQIENGLVRKVVADNVDSNFGGAERKDQSSVFTKLQKTHRHVLIGLGCANYIFLSTVQAGCHILPVGVEMFVSKIYLYFNLTAIVDIRNSFCDSVEIEFEMRLDYAQTKWIVLLSTIERVLKLFLPLKSYFQSQNKYPLFLLDLFEYPVSGVDCTLLTARLHPSVKQ